MKFKAVDTTQPSPMFLIICKKYDVSSGKYASIRPSIKFQVSSGRGVAVKIGVKDGIPEVQTRSINPGKETLLQRFIHFVKTIWSD